MTVRTTGTTSTGPTEHPAGPPDGNADQASAAQPEARDPGTQEMPDPHGADEGRDDDLPDWARKSLTHANAEAANYRTRLRQDPWNPSRGQTRLGHGTLALPCQGTIMTAA